MAQPLSVTAWIVGAVVLSLHALSRADGPAAPPAGGANAAPAPAAMRVYVGTYTGPKSKGIYLLKLDMATGALGEAELAGEVSNPSFLAVHPGGKFIYAANEIGSFGGKKSGAVTAFAVAPDTGKLTLLNQQPSGGDGPCFVAVDHAGKNALVANYGGGSVEVLPLRDDGRLAEPSAFDQHRGKGADPSRQEGPHAHSINVDAADRFAFAADLGLDKIIVYRFDPAKGTLSPHDPPADVAPGSGPRHFAFHPAGRFAYAINEMANTVTAFEYDADKGALREVQTVPTLPAGFDGTKSSTAEVRVHPSGKFLYGSNRGHDSIAVFAIDAQTGKLTPAGHQSTQGKSPRNFGIDPTGTFLVAANQGSNTLVVFRIDPATGALAPTGSTAAVAAPVCVKFVPAP